MARQTFAAGYRAAIGALIGLLVVAALGACAVEAKALRLNIEADPATLSPIQNSELISGDIIDNMYEGLTAIDKDGRVVPALAEKWQALEDGKGFRFWLHKGVRFHSGRELGAADVKWTFEQILTPAQKGGLGVTYLTKVVGAREMLDGKATELPGVKVVDAHTVDIRLTEPDVLFPMYPLRVVDRQVVKEHGPDWVQKVSAGTGPFTFVHWKRGVEVRLAAFPGYRRGAPPIDGVAFVVVPQIDTAISMYEAGELDLVLEDLAWPDAAARFAAGAVVVVPVGALAKEHGPHLPLKTDWLVAPELARRVALKLPVIVAPVVSLGYYPAFVDYPGSQHLRAETFGAMLTDVFEGLIRHGVTRIAVINTGVSTEAPLRVVVREVYARHRVRIAVADIRGLGRGADVRLGQKLGGHGDEVETSLVLAIDPGAVRMERAAPDYGNMPEAPATVFYQPTVFSGDPAAGLDYSKTGVRGDPTLATAEKGEAILAAMARELIDGIRALFPGATGPIA